MPQNHRRLVRGGVAAFGLLDLNSLGQQPSKEYIRLGGRVIAIESPTLPSGGGGFIVSKAITGDWNLVANGVAQIFQVSVTAQPTSTVTQSVTLTCTFPTTLVRCDSITAPVLGTTTFEVKLVDHKIDVPTLVVKNIAEVIKVDCEFAFVKYSK